MNLCPHGEDEGCGGNRLSTVKPAAIALDTLFKEPSPRHSVRLSPLTRKVPPATAVDPALSPTSS